MQMQTQIYTLGRNLVGATKTTMNIFSFQGDININIVTGNENRIGDNTENPNPAGPEQPTLVSKWVYGLIIVFALLTAAYFWPPLLHALLVLIKGIFEILH